MLKIECNRGEFNMEFAGTGLDMITETVIIIKAMKEKISEDSGMPPKIVDAMIELTIAKMK